MSRKAWLSQDTIPSRKVLAISLPDNEKWRADFLGALLLLCEEANWEEFGLLTPEEMASEWLKILFDFTSGGTSMLPVATILEYAGDVLPPDFLWCRAGKVSRSTYAELFAIIGVKFGEGNGTTTFTLPDLRGQTGFGYHEGNNKFDPIGYEGGKQNHNLTIDELPVFTVIQDSHTHTQDTHNHNQVAHNHGQVEHAHTVYGNQNADNGVLRPSIANVGGLSEVITSYVAAVNIEATAANVTQVAVNQAATPTNQAIGGGQAHTNLPPYVVLNYIIKYR